MNIPSFESKHITKETLRSNTKNTNNLFDLSPEEWELLLKLNNTKVEKIVAINNKATCYQKQAFTTKSPNNFE